MSDARGVWARRVRGEEALADLMRARAIAQAQEGLDASALARLARTQERHYSGPILQWLATFFGEQGLAADTSACAAALSCHCRHRG